MLFRLPGSFLLWSTGPFVPFALRGPLEGAFLPGSRGRGGGLHDVMHQFKGGSVPAHLVWFVGARRHRSQSAAGGAMVALLWRSSP